MITGCKYVDLTQSVITRVYRTIINKNLKKCAGSFAKPAIQYVLGRWVNQGSGPVESDLHGANDDVRNNPQRDDIEDEPRQ